MHPYNPRNSTLPVRVSGPARKILIIIMTLLKSSLLRVRNLDGVSVWRILRACDSIIVSC